MNIIDCVSSALRDCVFVCVLETECVRKGVVLAVTCGNCTMLTSEQGLMD